MTEPIQLIDNLYYKWSGKRAVSITPMPESGSYRRYFRINESGHSLLGVYNSDIKENEAFIYLQHQLLSTGSKVPAIIATDLPNHIYLEEDLGSVTLFDYLTEMRKKNCQENEITPNYKKVIDAMPGLQIHSTVGIDYSNCYPRAEFDVQSMMWDMNYFKYCLLKPLKIDFFEQDLEDDFTRIVQWLIKADRPSFMFRDFQSRNIMLTNNDLYFIDFQGGRKGPLQYDIASLLFEAKTNLSEQTRNELLEYYLDVFSKSFPWFNRVTFLETYYGFVYLRLMQAMGAYGFRGYIERKPVFLQSLPYAIRTLKWLLKTQPIPLKLVSLPHVFEKLIQLPQVQSYEVKNDIFTITINSFSYKNGIPQDHSGNGGGFVFDCRCLENPGRYAEYKQVTGRDRPVIEFLQDKADVLEFISHTFPVVLQSANVYTHRGFTHLSVSFGCTGGQHRSVYLAERLAEYLKEQISANLVVIHHELGKLKK